MGKSNEWYTPARYTSAARLVMGGIDLDPASCEQANEIVQATRFYTEEENGLAQVWYGRVWLNPPFGTVYNQQSNQALFTNRLVLEHRARNIEQAVLLTTLKPACSYFKLLWDYPLCFADHHVQFHRPNGEKKDQMFGVCFAYLGPHLEQFMDIFSEFGPVIPGGIARRRKNTPPAIVQSLLI